MAWQRRDRREQRTAVAPRPRPDATPRVDGIEVPRGLRLAAAWSWRLLLVAVAIWAVLWLLGTVSVVLVPVVIGLLLAAAGSPVADRLQRCGLPRGPATLLVVISGIAVLTGLVALITQQVSSGFGDLRNSFEDSLNQLQRWLIELGISQHQIDSLFARLRESLPGSGNRSLGGTVVTATATVGHVVAGLFIALFSTIFFIYDGRGIWRWIVRLFPASARERVHGSGERAWVVLTSYVRATFLIALTDAIGVSLVALALRLPLVVPIGVLVFLGAFIPVVGATVSGVAAVAVALVTHGPVAALIMVGGVIAVQQLESHVLQPFLMGRFVRVHPLAVVLVIAIGALTAGIFGALVAVPLAAIVNTVGNYLAGPPEQAITGVGEAADPAATGR